MYAMLGNRQTGRIIHYLQLLYSRGDEELLAVTFKIHHTILGILCYFGKQSELIPPPVYRYPYIPHV